MSDTEALYERHAQSAVEAALGDTRVVVINGARQSGKSTLARLVTHNHPNAEVRYLDDVATRLAASTDPTGFVRHPGLLVLDEIQRVPELMLAIKHQVDLDPRPGRFLLTGSAQLFALQTIPDLLPGRTETIELWPLSEGEINHSQDQFVEKVFEDGQNLNPPPSELHRPEYLQRALRGGYPEAVRRADLGRRRRFFDMRRLLSLVSAQMATLAVPGSMASALGVPVNTIKRYLDLLELLFVIRRIPAWSNNLTTRAVATPKLIFIDSGLAGHLADMTLQRAQHPTAVVGPLLENFVLSELARQLSWTFDPIRLYHYRDRDGYEVDAVLERGSGDVVAIEVKAGETVRGDDFRGLRHLQSRLGDRFIAGIVLHTGTHVLPFGDRLRAWPISSLWTV